MAPKLWNLPRERKQKMARRARRRPLVVEQLEGRLLLSAPPPFILNSQGSASPAGGYTPAQIRQVYGFNQISGLSGNNYNYAGSGQTIAIIDSSDAPTVANDLQQFDEYFRIGGAANNPGSLSFFTVVNQDGGQPSTQSGLASALEASRQDTAVEWAHAIAPGANMLLVEADSNSYADLQTAVLYAASQPAVSVVCAIFNSVEGTTPDPYASIYTTPVGHQGVAFVAISGDSGAPPTDPSADPNVLGVGGTTLPANASGNPNLSAESGWSGSGGGISAIEPQPTYQQGIVTQSSTNRTTPDVAYDADPSTGFDIYDSDTNQPGMPWFGVGTTGAGTAQWAALIAIADQQRLAAGEKTLDGPSQLLPALYQISQTVPAAFNEITTGASTGNPGYSAGPGYDLVTGLGTPNAQLLVPALVNAFAAPALSNTIYWTGDAGPDAAGNYNWDEPGNWSDVDPKSSNVPEDVLPGPNDNVVIDIVGANIVHSDASYDTISSLTATAKDVYLNLDGGTLDLSGSGAAGTLEVPGTVDFAAGLYGEVDLNGGVLANANVAKDTAIAVLGSANAAAADANSGKIQGGVLNGTIEVNDGGYATLDLAGKWVNNGTITADDSNIVLGDFWSAGLADPNASQDAWVNKGTISTKNSVVELGGWLTYDPSVKNLASLDLSTAIDVALIGTLDNTAADNPATPSVLTLSPGVTSSSGNWSLLAGRIDQGSLAATGGAALVSTSGGGTLDGVSIGIGAAVQVSNDASVTFEGQGWSNNGAITVSDNATLNLFGSWTNYGNITVGSGSGVTSTVSFGSPINIAPTSAAAANYAWANDGTIAIPDTSTVNLGGVFNTYAFDGLITDLNSSSQDVSGDTFNLTGTLDNSAADNPVNQDTLALGSAAFPLNLSGGRIYGGAITTSGSDDLVATASGGTLDGVTLGGILLNGMMLAGTFNMTQVAGASAHVIDGLTLDSTIKLGGPTGTPYQTSLYFGTQKDKHAQTIGGKGTIQLGTQNSTDSLFDLSTSKLTFGPTVTLQGGLQSVLDAPYGTILNKGTIEDADKGGIFEVYGAAAIDVSGKLVYGSCLANYVNGTLSGGSWEATNGGQLWLSGVTINANAATILVSGSTSGIYADAGITNSLSYLTVNAAHGKLTLQNGYTLDTQGSFSNAGTVLIGSNGLISTGTSGYTQTAGTTTVDGGLGAASFVLSGGAVTVGDGGSLSTGAGNYMQSKGTTTVAAGGFLNAANFLLNGGALKGSGTIQAELTNAASIAPLGTLTLQGDYTQTAAGLVNITLGGSGQGQYGELAISGNATLNGKLKISLAKGYTPAAGTSFPLVTYKNLSGTFHSLIGLNLGNGLLLTPQFGNAALMLTATQNTSSSPRTLYWTGAAGDGDWDDPGNWSDVDPLVAYVPESVLPGPEDNVVVDLNYQYINHADVNYDLISSLTVTGQNVTLNLVGGTLDVSGSGARGVLQAGQTGDRVVLSGGVLAGAQITSGTTITATATAGVLDGVELDGTLDMTNYYLVFNGISYSYQGAQVQVLDGLTLDGTIELGGSFVSADLFLGTSGDSSSLTVTGTGSIQFSQASTANYLYGAGEGTLTFGPNVVIQGGKASYILADDADGGTIDNQGTIEEHASGGQLTLDLGAGVNDGSIQVGGGAALTVQGQGWSNSPSGQITATAATLNLYNNWTNLGTITVDPSTVSLGSPGAIDPTDPLAADDSWSNQGTLSIAAGSTVNVGGVMTTDQFNALIAELRASGQVAVGLTGTLDNSAADNPVSGGVLALGAETGPLSLEGGEIYQGDITSIGNNDLVATTLGGTLDGVTLDGTFDMTQFQGSYANVIDGLTLNGTIELGGAINTPNYADLYFGSSGDNVSQTVSGTGSIQVGPAYFYYVSSNFKYIFSYTTIYNASNDTLTLGPNITINGAWNNNTEFAPELDISSYGANSGGVDNQGMIQEAAELSINVGQFTNEGSIQAGFNLTINAADWVNDGSIISNGYYLSLYGSWTNNGTIAADGQGVVSLGNPTSLSPTDPSAPGFSWSSPGAISIADGNYLNLGGVFTADTFDALVADLQANGESLANDTVTLTGTLDDSMADNPQSGGILSLNASTGPLYLGGLYQGVIGGRIYMGEITTKGSNDLRATGGTLDGVTLEGTLDMSQGAPATIVDGMTLNGTILLGNYAYLYFGSQDDYTAETVSGTGSIQFGAQNVGNYLDNLSNYTLTFGPNITIQGGLASAIVGPIDSQGTIVENTSGGQLTIVGAPWVNDGSVAVSNGATLNLYGNWTNDGTITVAVSTTVSLGSPINISPTDPTAPGSFWSNHGTLTIANGDVVNLGGVFTTDALDALNAYFAASGQSLASFTINLDGTLDNSALDNPQSGGNLMLSANTGPLNLAGGRIYQGTITTSGSDDLVAGADDHANYPFSFYYQAQAGGTLDGVTLDGTLDMTQPYFPEAQIINGLTLNGTIAMAGASDSATLNFGAGSDNVAQAITGTGTIQCDEGSLYNYSNKMLTIGSGITIVGGVYTTISSIYYYYFVSVPNNGSYYQYYYGGPITTEGTIEDNAGGGQLTIAADGWINNASIEVGSDVSATLQGVNREPQGQVYNAFYGNPTVVAPWTNNGTITAGPGTTLNLYGGWTNNGAIRVASVTVALGSPVDIDPTSAAAAPYVWTNKGTLTIADGATVDLGGIITTDQYLDNLADVGVTAHLITDTVNLIGSLDSSVADNPQSGGVLAISAATGPLFLYGGLIHQGTITTSGSDDLVAEPAISPTVDNDSYFFGTLDGVTLDGTFDMSQLGGNGGGADADVINGLTLNGIIKLGGAAGTNNYADLIFGQQYVFFPTSADYASQTVEGTGTIQFGQDSAGDSLDNLSSAMLTFGPSITIQGGLLSTIVGNYYSYSSFGLDYSGPIENQGTIEENTSGGVLTTVANARYFGVTPFANYSAGTLTGGTWEVSNGGALILGNTITTNAATIELSGAGSGIYEEPLVYGTMNDLANFTTNTAAGSFTVAKGYTFMAPGAFSNAGAVTVGSGGTFTVGTSNYTQSQGTTTVDGTLSAANVNLNGGELNGTGTIEANVINAATVSPGDQPGTLTIQGNYTQTAAGTLDIAIDGTSQYGQLSITGTATLAGILNVSLENGFTPSSGDSFLVLISKQLSGTFTTINGLTFGTGQSLVPVYSGVGLNLTFGSQQRQQITVTSAPQTIKELQNIVSGPIELATFQATLPDSFDATVNWGDGTTQSSSSSANVWLSVSGTQIIVYGKHMYSTGASFVPVVTVASASYASATAQATTTTINVGKDVSTSATFKKTAAVHDLQKGKYNGLYESTLTVTNTSKAPISGSLEILLSGLAAQSPGVTLEYANVTIGGTTYSLSISTDSAGDPVIFLSKSILSSLAKGGSLAISLYFGEAAATFLLYSPKLFTDPFDS
ncbi:MAG TPA: hypothetical protein VK395_04500 [Gemmataceae bacterium]|nr:hypothetical protein [Gemmataceae bacterium]